VGLHGGYRSLAPMHAIGAVLHPTVLPRTRRWRQRSEARQSPIRRIVRIVGLRSLVISIEMAPERRIVLFRHSFRPINMAGIRKGGSFKVWFEIFDAQTPSP